ncbi:long-chain fatty acid--CoA ligase [Nocardioides anomalus]|uniref:Long-chain fatty acid--CoA ligase n=1 Tax=Nocardioides anomalus TaxID=2712223 RepID=A0A6G6WK95_9ACTN|nr:AMP-binding protein [Nocardioides anomalus]QIG45490.1 long-chain fatty acid--CoA ligase [Nocardioides anomalus]
METLNARWADRVAREPGAACLLYFDGRLTVAEVDRLAASAAADLSARGVGRGDRVALQLQNTPHFPVLMLALWRLGAAAVLVNPMYAGRELHEVLADSGAVGLACPHALAPAAEAATAGTDVAWTLVVSERSFQRRDDPRVFASPRVESDDLVALPAAEAAYADVGPDDPALFTYTSGTTGPPKAALNTHANLLAVCDTYAPWVGLVPGDRVFAMAPLFHITGAVVNATIALVHDCALVLIGRFRPDVAIDAFVEHRVSFTIGAITAFNAIAALPHAAREHFASFTSVYSGGAPIPPSTVARFEERFGVYVHNAYGMTETSSAVVAVPRGTPAPVDPAYGALAIGQALPSVTVRVLDDAGQPVPPGTEGQLEVTGAPVVPGYWQRPEETARTLPKGHLRTGDVAVMDEDGWVFLVDRLKDQINTSGYKVWPREVEDVLYLHPAVHEAAVVGRPDDYRGEAVVAFVAVREGAEPPADLEAFCRERLAAYKVPREFLVVDELPKTQTGKIRRRELRERPRPGQ